jgi:hypothetical protein
MTRYRVSTVSASFVFPFQDKFGVNNFYKKIEIFSRVSLNFLTQQLKIMLKEPNDVSSTDIIS